MICLETAFSFQIRCLAFACQAYCVWKQLFALIVYLYYKETISNNVRIFKWDSYQSSGQIAVYIKTCNLVKAATTNDDEPVTL